MRGSEEREEAREGMGGRRKERGKGRDGEGKTGGRKDRGKGRKDRRNGRKGEGRTGGKGMGKEKMERERK